MDLRKAILLKKPLQDSSFSSLNSSTASMYESAAEDSDSSLYYSFSNNSIKELNNSEVENVQDPADVSLISEADDKENTVIMKHIDIQSSPEEDIKKVEDKIPEKEEEVEQMEINDSVMNTTYTEEDQKVSADKQIPEISNSLIVMSEKSLIIPTIIVEDPNENLVNPFTMGEINPSTSTSSSTEGRESIETDNVTKRKVQEVAKKSASRIPTRSHLYSPIRRNSLDKKSKIITKPAIQRRTVFETRSAAVQKPTTIQKPKQPVNPPVQSKMAVPKPVLHKCTSSGCLREFHTVKLLEQHLKSHNSDSSSSSSTHSTFKCKWCDKIFERNNALTLHMIDKCTKITFPEKRKLLAQQDKSNQTNDNKRRTVFMAPPAPKKRSPRRITTHNKSGIMITPKKTLKCECGKKFTDVLEFANHTITHKYENALKSQPT